MRVLGTEVSAPTPSAVARVVTRAVIVDPTVMVPAETVARTGTGTAGPAVMTAREATAATVRADTVRVDIQATGIAARADTAGPKVPAANADSTAVRVMVRSAVNTGILTSGEILAVTPVAVTAAVRTGDKAMVSAPGATAGTIEIPAVDRAANIAATAHAVATKAAMTVARGVIMMVIALVAVTRTVTIGRAGTLVATAAARAAVTVATPEAVVVTRAARTGNSVSIATAVHPSTYGLTGNRNQNCQMTSPHKC